MTAAPDRAPGRHLVVVGPTASGKSAAAVELAVRRTAAGRPVEIVSCDSMAVYRGMDVGTATPTASERAGVPHHLLDVVDPSEEFSVQRFVGLVDRALDDIEGRGADAVLVGGTGLYVRAVTDRLALPGRYPEVAAGLEAVDTDGLRRRLVELDPVAASRVPPGNRRRLIRALEVTIGSGTPFSAAGPGLGDYPPTPFVLAGLRLPRAVLTERIGARYRRQVADGFVEEVQALAAQSDGLSRTAAEALGYRELREHLAGVASLDQALDAATARTRRFAVRQERWFRRDPRIQWFDADADDLVGLLDAEWRERARAGRGSATTVGAVGPADPPD